MVSPTIPDPSIVQQQRKSLADTAHSFYKAGMGLTVQNSADAMALNKRISDRFQDKLDGKKPADNTAANGAEKMRIDSDDIHYHVHSPTPASKGGGLAKGLLGAGLIASAIGLPAGAWMLASAAKPVAEKVIERVTTDTDVDATATIELPE